MEQLSTCLETFGQTVSDAKFSFFVQAGTPWAWPSFWINAEKFDKLPLSGESLHL